MKKFWFWLFLLGLFSLVGTNAFAEDCKQVEFENGGRVCVNIQKENNNNFELETDIERGSGILRCGILLSNNTYKEIPGCNDNFFVSTPKEQLIKLYIKLGSSYPSDREGKPNNKNERLFPQWMYDFDDGEWSDNSSNDDDDDDDNDNDDNDYEDVDNFYITTDDSSPDTYQRVDLRIKARDDNNNIVENYTNAVEFVVYYRTSSSSSWIETTSSTYFELDDDYEDGYDFSSSDDGDVTLSDAIRFKRDYEYKVEVIDEDDDDISGYKIFDVGDNNDDDDDDDNDYEDVDNFYITTDDSSPDTYQRVDLRIKARDDNNNTVEDYTNAVEFVVYYRTSSSSSWIETSSSTYFELDDDYEDGYDFSSSDDGDVTLSDAIRFKRDYEYKVKIIDDDSSSIYGERTFDVGDNNDDDDNWDINDFQVTTDNSSPDTNQRVDLRIKARDDNWSTVTNYRNTVKFEIYYRTSSSSSWIKTTSSTYFELKSSYDNTYTFTSSDYGYATLYDAIRFKKDYEYKVKVIDDDSSSIYGERTFDVGDNSSWIYGFTSTEIANIQKVYNLRDDLINSLKRASSKLRYNQTRLDLSADLKIEMKRIIDNSSYKKYNTYKEFWTAFNNRYSYTLRNK
jgi:predicted component of type VI protein secretion system